MIKVRHRFVQTCQPSQGLQSWKLNITTVSERVEACVCDYSFHVRNDGMCSCLRSVVVAVLCENLTYDLFLLDLSSRIVPGQELQHVSY